ncbi:GNAT family N-acetyltransferase [Streptomyces sp. TR06-5]|uniref:GNAT family N-acetyltransferase n=1 Tax=unclassified Streptomyces TaxID=2593676 RepID=UPI0039A096F0
MTESNTRRIRAGREDDLVALGDLERAAGEQFRALGMDAVADDEPFSPGELRPYLHRDGLHVAVDDRDRPIAYLLTEPVDGCLHIEQVSVHPDHARRGVGRALLDDAARRASARGLPALTLTTFTEVPWNAPYYERCGFRRLGAAETTPGLRALRAREAAAGLDRWPRVCMRRPLDR